MPASGFFFFNLTFICTTILIGIIPDAAGLFRGMRPVRFQKPYRSARYITSAIPIFAADGNAVQAKFRLNYLQMLDYQHG